MTSFSSFLLQKKIYGLIAVLLSATFLIIWLVGPLIAIGTIRPLESPETRIGVIITLFLSLLGLKLVNKSRLNSRISTPSSSNTSPAIASWRNPELHPSNKSIKNLYSTSDSANSFIVIGSMSSGKTSLLSDSDLSLDKTETQSTLFTKPIFGRRTKPKFFEIQLPSLAKEPKQSIRKQAKAKASPPPQEELGRNILGVIYTISSSDILPHSGPTTPADLPSIQHWFTKLSSSSERRIPLYIVITKFDLLAGFAQAFEAYDDALLSEPWGIDLLPLSRNQDETSHISNKLDALLKKVNADITNQLKEEDDFSRRALMFAFSSSFSLLCTAIKKIPPTLLGGENSPIIRGIYFSSTRQSGDAPLSGRSFLISGILNIASHKTKGKRKFFSLKLVNYAADAERYLISLNELERRKIIGNILKNKILLSAAIFCLGAILIFYKKSQLEIDNYSSKAQLIMEQVSALTQAQDREISPINSISRLQRIREQINELSEANKNMRSIGLGGLSQIKTLEESTQLIYSRAIYLELIPLLYQQVIGNIKNSNSNPEFQYEALKVYVMLHDPNHFDPNALKAYFMADWDQNLPRSVTTDQRAELNSYLDDLLAQGLAVSPLPEDRKLISDTRARLVSIPLAQRVYKRLKQQGVGEDIPEFTVAKAAGNSAALVFMRASGAPLTKGVPGLFTFDGYHKGFQPQVEQATKQLSEEESWVLGVQDSADSQSLRDPTELRRLTDDVLQIYLNEYAAVWEAFIADIRLTPSDSLPEIVQMTRLLSNPESPLKSLLTAISRETTLRRAQDKSESALEKSRQEIAKLFGAAPMAHTAPDEHPIESLVDDRFIALRAIVGDLNSISPLPVDRILGQIQEVYILLTATEAAVQAGNIPPPGRGVFKNLKLMADRSPAPLRSLLQDLSLSDKIVNKFINSKNIHR